ncbi:unnamed protein product, partial [Rotaria sordida]
DGRIDYYTSISPEYRFEKLAIEKLIQEYLESIDSSLTHYNSSSSITSLMSIYTYE